MSMTIWSLGNVHMLKEPNNFRQIQVLLKDGMEFAPIDRSIAQLVLKLNAKGYDTSFSCSGLLADHAVYDDTVDEGYLDYLMGEMQKDVSSKENIPDRASLAWNLRMNLFVKSGYISFVNKLDIPLPESFRKASFQNGDSIYLDTRLYEPQKAAAWAALEAIVDSVATRAILSKSTI